MKQKGEPFTLLARKIIKEHSRTGYVGAIIYAPRGYGKSSFAIQTLYDLYHNGYGLGRKEAYDKALNQLLFDLPEIASRIKDNLALDVPTEGLIFDDAGVYFSGQTYSLRYNWHSLLKSFLDTVRLATSSILMTTPNVKDLASYVRRHDDHFVRIKKTSGGFDRMAVIYSQYTLPSGTIRFKKIGETDFSCYLPNVVYDEYSIKRKKMLADIIVELTERIEQGDAEAIVYDGLHGYKKRDMGVTTKKAQVMNEFYNDSSLTLSGLSKKFGLKYQTVCNYHSDFIKEIGKDNL